MNLYSKNRSASVDEALFRSPTAEYRGTPFWSWNSDLDLPQLMRQVEQFKQMGMGGFHMHSRTGLTAEYLGEEYFRAVAACTKKARDEQMLAWLYDEDRWPSGAAGGLVTRDERYRARYLLFTPRPYGVGKPGVRPDGVMSPYRSETGRLLARYEVRLENGYLAHYRQLMEGESAAAGSREWFAYLEIARPHAWFNNQTYLDTLNPKAVERFVEVTYDAYHQHVGDSFGSVIPAIFTDEPQFIQKQFFQRADDEADICLPFTDDLFDTYAATHVERLEPLLPELFWELPDRRASRARYRYHDHVAERFASAFADTIGRWCEKHHIAFTGHMMAEESLQSQTWYVGEAMRSYRSFHIPGIDILCDSHEYTTAKQAQSAAHQYGRPAVLSELYGVTNWDFDFAGHIAQGNWQAALGVTVRVHHLMLQSMAGESKRDYPASIGYQAPWWKEYSVVEDYFSRLNVLLTRGRPVVRVGVIHPIESFWLAYGPIEQTRMERDEREQAFRNVTEWLLFGLIDFDFIAESLLPPQSSKAKKSQLEVGQMRYDAVVVPAMRTIRSSTLDRLESFADAGGTILFAGEMPTLVDAEHSDRAIRLASRCRRIDLVRTQLLSSLEPFREIGATTREGSPQSGLLTQMRQDGEQRHVFVCNTARSSGLDGERAMQQGSTLLRLRGEWEVTLRDAMSGTLEPLAARYDDGHTLIERDIPAAGSMLLTLEPGRRTEGASPDRRAWVEMARIEGPVPVTLSEPNVLLLDQAEWRLAGDSQWQSREEILRLDNLVRRRLGLPDRKGHICQPWAEIEPMPVLAEVELRFQIETTVPIASSRLAVQLPEESAITLNGRPVPLQRDGWWTDEAIHTYPLPPLSAGTHELLLRVPFRRLPGLEWAYLLGDFGVRVQGRCAQVITPVRELHFGDWTQQGLPFYGGNVIYHCTVKGADAPLAIDVAHFRAPLVGVTVDGIKRTPILLPPFRANLGALPEGIHQIDLEAFGSRINCFGQLHNADARLRWFGPASWRTVGAAWSDEYKLKPAGLLQAPMVRAQER